MPLGFCLFDDAVAFLQQIDRVILHADDHIRLMGLDVLQDPHFRIVPQIQTAGLIKAGIEEGLQTIGKGIAEDQAIRQRRAVRLDKSFRLITSQIGSVLYKTRFIFRQIENFCCHFLSVVPSSEWNGLVQLVDPKRLLCLPQAQELPV